MHLDVSIGTHCNIASHDCNVYVAITLAFSVYLSFVFRCAPFKARLTVVSHEAKKKQYASVSSAPCNHCSELRIYTDGSSKF